MADNELDIYDFRNSFDDYKHVESKRLIEGKVQTPFFTIMIPTYKRAETIKAAISSALAQSEFDDFEVLIINNAFEEGEDETGKAILSFGSEKISYYVNEDNIGLCGNWNRCIEKAKGQYIVMLHDDDVISPYTLKALYDTILKYGNPVMLGCSNATFTSRKMPVFDRPDRLVVRKITKEGFYHGRYLGIVGMTFRKDIAIEVGGFADEYYPNEDTIFIYQMMLKGCVLNIENVLVGYRTEINLTTSGDTLKKIVIMTERMRRSIAKREGFAAEWLKKYDKADLYSYIQGANRCWNGNIDYKEIFGYFGLGEERPSYYSICKLWIASRLEKMIHARKETI